MSEITVSRELKTTGTAATFEDATALALRIGSDLRGQGMRVRVVVIQDTYPEPTYSVTVHADEGPEGQR